MPYTAKTYKRAQFLAYACPTLAITAPGSAKAVLPPVRKLTDPDERARVQRMFDVASFVKSQAPWRREADVLKVFIAPEFYFRPQNAEKAYTFNRAINIIECLHQLFGDSTWADWLILPGTVFSALPGDAKQGSYPVVNNKGQHFSLEKAYLNTCVVVKGGGPGAPFHYVHKRHISHIDGAPQIEAAGINPLFRPTLEAWTELKQRLFKVDNLTIGIDICKDHYDSELKNVVRVWPSREGTPAPSIHLHLVTSCGAQVQVNSVVAKQGGYIMHCDGIKNPDPWFLTTLQRVENFSLAGPATLMNPIRSNWRKAIPSQSQIPTPKQFEDEAICYPEVALVI